MSKRNQTSAKIPRHARGLVDSSIRLAILSAAIDLVNDYQRRKIGYFNLIKRVRIWP